MALANAACAVSSFAAVALGFCCATTAGLLGQLDASLAALRVECVDIFYLHAPDVNASLEETLGAVQAAFTAGHFKRFALSNFTAWETVWIHGYMSKQGWVVPTIYQGMLNALTRKATEELLPALRRCGMAFYAYNPLAGGMLTGKHSRESMATQADGRFTAATPWGKIYRDRYMQEQQFAALDLVLAALASSPAGSAGTAADGAKAASEASAAPNPTIDPAEAALRWCMHHAGLDATHGDAVIVGAR